MLHARNCWHGVVGALVASAVVALAVIAVLIKLEDTKAVIQRGGSLSAHTMTKATPPPIPHMAVDSVRTRALAQRFSLWNKSAGARSATRDTKKATKHTYRRADISDVLYVVTTDSIFYETRVRTLLDTWGSDVPLERLLMIGDRVGNVGGATIESSNCEAHSHGRGACCKNADAVYSAYARMQKNTSLAWAYFSDDDAYVVVKNMASELNSAAIRLASHGVLRSLGISVGVHGCRTDACNGLCGGGGYALDRQALERLVSKRSRQQFIAEQMKACDKCQQWGDQALSVLIQQRGIKEVEAHGMNGGLMNAQTFAKSLISTPPLSYHYIRTEGQMKFLHGLFSLTRKHGTCAPGGSFCAQYAHRDGDVRKCCTRSNDRVDRPWSRRLSGAQRGADRLAIASLKHRLGLRGPWPRKVMEERLLADGVEVPPCFGEDASYVRI